MESYKKRIEEFTEYVNNFYNENYGIYPIASEKEIDEAIDEFMNESTDLEFLGDTFDRERVRTIIEKNKS